MNNDTTDRRTRRFGQRAARNLSAALAVLVALGSLTALSAAPASAAAQNGCTFSAPTPKIVSGKANFTISINCTSNASWDRQIVWDLVGNDLPARTHVMKWGVKQISKKGNYSWSFTGWPCNEDVIGNDEIYIAVRTGTRSAIVAGAGGGYKMASWVNGKTVSGGCK